jgi:hypothetical protein
MPTKEDWQELLDHTSHTCTNYNGVNGWLFTASNGNTLFLAAAGSRYDGDLYDDGVGNYWSRSLMTDPYGDGSVTCGTAACIRFNNNQANIGWEDRMAGLSVRPVCP